MIEIVKERDLPADLYLCKFFVAGLSLSALGGSLGSVMGSLAMQIVDRFSTCLGSESRVSLMLEFPYIAEYVDASFQEARRNGARVGAHWKDDPEDRWWYDGSNIDEFVHLLETRGLDGLMLFAVMQMPTGHVFWGYGYHADSLTDWLIRIEDKISEFSCRISGDSGADVSRTLARELIKFSADKIR